MALGGLAWAYFAQQQAGRLAKAIEQAEQAAAEASRQTKIAETQRLEAERQRQEADRAREFSESAASEASRQQQIADTQREDAFRQRQQALRARADAETAASEAFLQKNLAEQQRTIAEERQTEIAKNEARVQETNQALVIALQERLSSNNPDEVIGALDILIGSNEDANQVLAQLDENWFTSTRGLTPLLLSLNSLANVDPSVQQVKLRQMLVNRLAENSSLNSPPVSLNGVQRVRLGAFYIQQYEVTNGEYRQFNPNHNTEEPDKHPVTKISWYDAMIYSAWLGGTLPSAAEWEYAASGSNSRVYPWGNDPPNSNLAIYASQSRRVNTNLKAAPVGSYPEGATPELIHDLAGNVWEWCRDSELDTRILKGGSYFNTARFLENTSQNLFHPEETGSLVGFRVLWPISLE